MEKYGKEIDMWNLNRDLDNICEMKKNRKDAALKNLIKFDSNVEILCPICKSKEYGDHGPCWNPKNFFTWYCTSTHFSDGN